MKIINKTVGVLDKTWKLVKENRIESVLLGGVALPSFVVACVFAPELVLAVLLFSVMIAFMIFALGVFIGTIAAIASQQYDAIRTTA